MNILCFKFYNMKSLIASNCFYFVFFFVILWFIVCYWNIFKKAWRKWWETLIPIRNIYVLYKIIWYKRFFCIWIIFTVITIIEFILSFTIFDISFDNPHRSEIIHTYRSFSQYFSYWLAIYIIVSSLIVCSWLCKKFWKNIWFFLWLFFFRPFFLPALAFWWNNTYQWINYQTTTSLKKAIIRTLLITIVVFWFRTLIWLPPFIKWYYANFDKCPYWLRYKAWTTWPTDVCYWTTFWNVEVGDECEFFVGMWLIPADWSCDKYVEKLREWK